MRDLNVQLRRCRLSLVALCLLAGCAAESADDQPLDPTVIHARFSGRTFNGLERGNGFLLRLEPSGIASVTGPTAEYGRWRATEQGLCLKWYERPEICGAVYQIGFARYRVGDAIMNSQETFPDQPLDGGFGQRFDEPRLNNRWGRPGFGAVPP